MSRELKFRVWEEREKAYNTWNFILDTLGNLFRNVYGALIGCNEKDYIVEQYTGLKDRNGKEIYEGDIVKVYEWIDLTRGMEYRHTTKIFWQEKYAQFNTTYNDALSDEITQDYFEVIGNIHENKELL